MFDPTDPCFLVADRCQRAPSGAIKKALGDVPRFRSHASGRFPDSGE
jgi:hypothetical protein